MKLFQVVIFLIAFNIILSGPCNYGWEVHNSNYCGGKHNQSGLECKNISKTDMNGKDYGTPKIGRAHV